LDLLQQARSSIFESRIESAHALRLLGNEHFKADQIDKAMECYDRGLYHVGFDEAQLFELSDTHVATVNAERLPLHLNKGLCLTKLANTKANQKDANDLIRKAMIEADSSLALQSNHFKALMLKGKSLVSLGRAVDGLDVLNRALTLAPSPSEAAAMKKIIKAAQVLAQNETTEDKDSKVKEEAILADESKLMPTNATLSKLQPPARRLRLLPLFICFLIAFVLAWRGHRHQSSVVVVSTPQPVLSMDTIVPEQKLSVVVVQDQVPGSWIKKVWSRLRRPIRADRQIPVEKKNGPFTWIRRVGDLFKRRRGQVAVLDHASHQLVAEPLLKEQRRWNPLKWFRRDRKNTSI
jgi:hypothetical protein